MMNNEVDGEQQYQIKKGKKRLNSKHSNENTHSEHDMEYDNDEILNPNNNNNSNIAPN